jgi:argininosuccinate lyase
MSTLWGGRFSKKTNALAEEFGKSIHFDYKLAEYDCIGSLAHIGVLKKAKLLTSSEYTKLEKGLNTILQSVKDGSFKIDPSFEDIHSYIQHLLEKDKSVGKAALKLHTCRSRNDQVVFDVKLYCKNNIVDTEELLANFFETMLDLSEKNKNIFIPGYTHLQHAIPVALSQYFLAYFEMLVRDFKRLNNALKNIELTLGSGALAGTFIEESKYNQTIQALQEEKISINPSQNSIDTVSDRDFVIEILSVLAIIGMHLSRLSEDMIMWASKEFDFIDIDESFCTGSSLMPQKKNPDILELVRGYTGRLYGNLMNVLVMMKGLPLAYNRDMQHDKEPLFDSFEIVQNELIVLTELFKQVTFKNENIKKQLDDESLYATDMADYLVKKGVAFKDAHKIIGNLIQLKYKENIKIIDMGKAVLKNIHPFLTPKIVKIIIDPKQSVLSKKSVRKRKQ